MEMVNVGLEIDKSLEENTLHSNREFKARINRDGEEITIAPTGNSQKNNRGFNSIIPRNAPNNSKVQPGRESYTRLPSSATITPKSNKISSFFQKEEIAFSQNKELPLDGYCFREFDSNFQIMHMLKNIVVKNESDFDFHDEGLISNPLFIPKRLS